ncbi:MAG: hypothetical protein SFV18_17210 [Bryobacteraceae bacterium]|nr:hypothetical protein [Bryobacteraceae bacterium]
MKYSACFLAAFAVATAPATAAERLPISENTTVIETALGQLLYTQTVVQEGAEPINRFTMHRLRRANLPARGTLLLLPPLGNNFNGYLTSLDGDISRSFAGNFARLGYDVLGYSPRETGIAAGACASGLDCTPALNWSLQTVVDDVAYIRSQIETTSPGVLPVIGGLSLGAISALATVNQYPSQYAGLLAWEGSLATNDAAIQAHNQTFCTQFEGAVAGGIVFDDQSLPLVKAVAQLAQTAPNDPFVIPVPGFPPGLTNRQAFLLILTTPNPVAPSPRPGFISAAGSVPIGQLFFSDEARLAANIADFNDVTANRTTRDLYCSLAGTETAYSSNLAQFAGPVFVVKAGQGFGSIMDELPSRLGSTAVTVVENGAFGHVDHLGSPNHLFLLEAPLAKWLGGIFP